MTMKIICPSCEAALRGPESVIGKKLQCPKCRNIFTIESPDDGMGADDVEERGWTAVHEAALAAISECEPVHLPDQRSINATNEEGWCLLHYAAALGAVDAVEALLAAGSHPNVRDPECGATPLYMAVTKEHIETIESLIAGGAATDPPGGEEGSSPLSCALSLSPVNERIVRILVKAGADVNPVKSDRRSPLHLAAAKGMLDAARDMIDRGADTEARDDEGRTPLDVVEKFCPAGKRAQMVRVLLGYADADPTTPEEQLQLGMSLVDADLRDAERLIKLAAAQGHSKAQELCRKLGAVDEMGEEFLARLSGVSGGSGVCADCGKSDPNGMYQQRSDGRRRCQACCSRLGPLMDV